MRKRRRLWHAGKGGVLAVCGWERERERTYEMRKGGKDVKKDEGIVVERATRKEKGRKRMKGEGRPTEGEEGEV